MEMYADGLIRISGIAAENIEKTCSFWRGNPSDPLELPSWHTVDTRLGRLGILYKKPYVVGIAFLGGGAMGGASHEGGEPEWQVFWDQWRLSRVFGRGSRFRVPEVVTEGPETSDSEWTVMAGKLGELFAVKTLAQESTPTSGGSPVEFALLGTAFQLKVWRILLEIPAGNTVSYQCVAQRLGQPQAARAVGQAVGANPLAWVIPCHRVLPRTGGLGGFRWGVPIKEKILLSERGRLPLKDRVKGVTLGAEIDHFA